jgi:hypothetical protein
MAKADSFYTLKEGETLSGVAQRHGTTTEALCKINGITDPDKIAAGRRIALNSRAVCKVTVQLLDRDRNPIPKAKIRLDYSGKRKELSSGQNGRVPTILTQKPEDQVKIFIARADGTWKHITEVSSGWGNKLVTLVSPKIRLEAKTMPHPKDEPGRPADTQGIVDKKPVSSPLVPKTTIASGKPQADFGNGNGPKTESTHDGNGLPVVKVTNDQIKLEFLRGYTGEKITENDYKKAAKALGSEPEVIKAIAEQESKSSAFDSENRPTILYERHWFSKLTNSKYDKKNHDISSRKPYTFRKKDKSGGVIAVDDRYGLSGSHQYRKLAKAYALDKRSALESCSWGKFQIMGFNYRTCGYNSIEDFVAIMCESEKKQLDAVCNFIKHNCHKAVKNKEWQNIAKVYNGKNYKENKYDESLIKIYNRLVAKRITK